MLEVEGAGGGRFPELERRLEEAKKKSIDAGQGCPSLPSLEVGQMSRTAEGYTEISKGNAALRKHDWEQVSPAGPTSPRPVLLCSCEHAGRRGGQEIRQSIAARAWTGEGFDRVR